MEFDRIYTKWLNGKTYAIDDLDESLILAFEKNARGCADKEAFEKQRFTKTETGEEIRYDLSPTTLQQLSQR